MAKQESASDWTEVLATRISTKAKRTLSQKLNELGGISQSAWLRQIVYKELGLTEEKTDA